MDATITIYQGNHKIQPVTIKDDKGAAIDLTGAALEFVVKSGDTAVFRKTSETGGGINVIDAVNGSIEIEITAIDSAIDEGDYKYELQLVDESQQPFTVLQGYFHIEKSLLIGG